MSTQAISKVEAKVFVVSVIALSITVCNAADNLCFNVTIGAP